ncbi:MAG: DUF2842 domain-containing protein [Pseudomonadota bacterium]
MRKPTAMLILLLYLPLYIIAAATVGSWLTEANGLVQLLFYIVAGVGWVLPLKPLMAWMNAGPENSG